MAFDKPAQETGELDVIIVGAGLSGVCAASHIAMSRPQDKFMILEARDAIGGTWDLFRYPGIRSDSDMFTLGFGFRPWTDGATLADGPSIREYVRETAKEYDLERRIAYSHKVVAADWSSEEARWTLTADTPEGRRTLKAKFVFCCTGYYDYDQGYTPDIPGMEAFSGQVIHPQAWPEDFDVSGKRFAVIGSGATAVTLVPSLADRGAKVVMVQRTPSYIMSMPGRDRVVRFLQRTFPRMLAYRLARAKNILFAMYSFKMAKTFPALVRKVVWKNAQQELGEKANVEVDFNPPYDPWDQRFCVAPDGDFFKAINRGDAEIVTGKIATVTESGLRMEEGREVEADVIVTATGLNLKLAGGMSFTVDGQPRSLADSVFYRGTMFSGMPNFGFTFGYTNASWTLKCELAVKWLVRLMSYMDRKGADIVTPTPPEDVEKHEFAALSSGYIERARDILPKQGARAPWAARQNYLRDLFGFTWMGFEDGLVFSKRGKANRKETAPKSDSKASEAA